MTDFIKMWRKAAAEDPMWQMDELLEEHPDLEQDLRELYFIQVMVWRKTGVWLWVTKLRWTKKTLKVEFSYDPT